MDLAIGPFSITALREEVIDFTVPFMQDGGGILTKGGEPGPDLLTVFNPLPLAMWLSLGGAVIVTGTVLYVITRSARQRHLGKGALANSPWTFGESLFIAFGSLVEQGTCWRFDFLPKPCIGLPTKEGRWGRVVSQWNTAFVC